jgi:hypothetical protein
MSIERSFDGVLWGILTDLGPDIRGNTTYGELGVTGYGQRITKSPNLNFILES